MNRIAEAFRSDFAQSGLEIPAGSLASREPGFIQSGGWLIQFSFGNDSRGEFLDYYASNRWTEDSHVRLYATGRRQQLASLASAYSSNGDPADEKHARAEFHRKNRRVARKLCAKGFDKFTINMFLHAGLAENDADPETDKA